MSITTAGRRAILPADVSPSLGDATAVVKRSDPSKVVIPGSFPEVRPQAGTGHSDPAANVPILAKGIGLGVALTVAFVINAFAGFCFMAATGAWFIGKLEQQRHAIYEARSE